MKILVDGNMNAKVKLGCLLDQVICNMSSRLSLIWIFLGNQFCPIADVIHFILNLEFLFERESGEYAIAPTISQQAPWHGSPHRPLMSAS